MLRQLRKRLPKINSVGTRHIWRRVRKRYAAFVTSQPADLGFNTPSHLSSTDFCVIQLEALVFLRRQIVTTMLSSVVAVTQNSPRTCQSAQRKGLVRHGLLATALRLRHSPLTGYLSPTPGFLIANLELEFPASCCKQRSELFSNRKFSAVLPSPRRILDPALRHDPATISSVPLFSSSLHPPASKPPDSNRYTAIKISRNSNKTKLQSNF
jgi:hypothetical protein